MIPLKDIIRASENRFLAFEIEFAEKMKVRLREKLGQLPTSLSLKLNWDNPIESVDNGYIVLNFQGLLYSQSKDWLVSDWVESLREIASKYRLKLDVKDTESYPVKFDLSQQIIEY